MRCDCCGLHVSAPKFYRFEQQDVVCELCFACCRKGVCARRSAGRIGGEISKLLHRPDDPELTIWLDRQARIRERVW